MTTLYIRFNLKKKTKAISYKWVFKKKEGIINCPRCQKSNLSVIDSRDISDGAIRRRRKCENCSYRFNTHERIDSVKLQIEKKNGSVEAYDRQKVIKGIQLATEKCKITDQQVSNLVDSLEQELIKYDQAPISSSKIGKGILKRLKSIDEVAYLRFSSVYKSFSSIKSFEKELAKLDKN